MRPAGQQADWRASGACRSSEPDLFFPLSSAAACAPQIATAKAICGGCQVRRQCLRFAVSTGQAHGIWGGTTEEERAGLRLAQRVRRSSLPDPGRA
jgi:WhiB family redox-sensing transcriptional regulator